MRRYVVAGGILAGPVLLTCCGNVLGIPSDSFLRETPDAGEDVDAAQLPPPPPPPPAGCTANQKLCDGACVPNDDPQYGCAGAACTPCSVAFASTLKCEAGRCAAAAGPPRPPASSPPPQDGGGAPRPSPQTRGR